MAQSFKEVAHTRTDMDAYGENYDRIFGKKESKAVDARREDRWLRTEELVKVLYDFDDSQFNYVEELILAYKRDLL